MAKKRNKTHKHSASIQKLLKKRAILIGIMSVVMILLVVIYNSYNINKNSDVTFTPSPTNALSQTPTPTLIEITSSYTGNSEKKLPVLTNTPTPTSFPTTGRIRFSYKKDYTDELIPDGGKIEVKAEDGSYNFVKENTNSITIEDLTPKKYIIIMHEPSGYSYHLLSVQNNIGDDFGTKYCAVKWDLEAGQDLDIKCLVKKN